MAFVTAAIVGGSIAAAGGLTKLGMSLAGRGDRIEEQDAAREEMKNLKKDYENLDTSNIYADARNQYAGIQTNFENTSEDLTVNQQQAQFQAQQGAETARGLEYSKTGTLLGMSQQRFAAANQARRTAAAQQMGAVGDIATAGLSFAGTYTDALKLKQDSDLLDYLRE